ncbi:MAG: dihydrolipoyl dehydrogenase [Deltaproteobacteria bacterium]|nr:MAG: dihydrolipoyl dehydrogenase [Deltaproteobacteria bacterium]
MPKNICIIGAGPGGYVAAVRSAQLGNNVTLIEKENLGGTCLNHGCIPSKIMKTASQLMEQAQNFTDFGLILKEPPEFDMKKLQEKKKKIIEIQQKGIEELLEHENIKVIKGTAYIKSPTEISVKNTETKNQTLSFDRLIIAAGTKTSELDQMKFDHKDILSSDDLLELDYVPESIAITGGGIIGCEFASILNGLGSEVTLIEYADRILPLDNLDTDISKALAREYKKKKIKVFTNALGSIIKKDETGFLLEIKPRNPKKKNQEIKCSKIAVCTGRTSLADTMGIYNAGIETDENGWMKTDKNYQTSCKNIFAIGDILGPKHSMLAHTASFEGRVCAEYISDNNFTYFDYEKIPGAIFTSPEIGFIGLSEKAARDKGFDVLKEKILFRTSAKAHAIGEINGEIIITADKNTKIILGIHIIGPHASDLLGEASIAVQRNISFTELANIVHAHPTLSEIIMETGLKLSGAGIHGK